nr:transcriptional regulator [Syntrophomonadaceae bacterium]
MIKVETVIANLNEFVPEAMDQVRFRLRVLRDVLYNQPVGRRQIAQRLGRSERTARSEIGALKEQGALEITPGGILLTEYGMRLISIMDEVVPYLEGLNPLANSLKRHLGLDEVILVPGDSYLDPLTKKELGRVAARYIKGALSHARILAVTGGSTLEEMGKAITPSPGGHEVLVLPARGGLGERMGEQANAIAAQIAQAMGGNYRLLHIPDSLDQETIDHLMTNQKMAEIVSQLKQCDIVVHGIGSALEMASRRGLAEEALKIL